MCTTSILNVKAINCKIQKLPKSMSNLIDTENISVSLYIGATNRVINIQEKQLAEYYFSFCLHVT